jgi:predicted NBD/HSP70 family sugar kinase
MSTTAPGSLPEITDSTRQALTLLLRRGPMARAELARRLGLSPPALTKLTRPLVDIGLLIEVRNVGRATAGRPAMPLAINPEWGRFVGIKVTGDRLYAVLANLCGTALRTREMPLASTTVDDVCDRIVQLVNEIADGAAVTGLGVGLAGSVIRGSGDVVSSPFLGWTDIPLADRLADRCGSPVSVDNDLRALTAAQHWFGEPSSSFALITFGAGIGCGLVIKDQVITGHRGVSGAVDHLRIRDDGPLCARGHRGCLSGFATTAAIVSATRGDRAVVDLPAVATLARQGDRLARSVLADAGYAVGALIGTVCNVTGPAKVVLSGEGAELYELIDTDLRRGIAEVIHPSLAPVDLEVRELSLTDWARGAAVIAIQDHLTLRTHRPDQTGLTRPPDRISPGM